MSGEQQTIPVVLEVDPKIYRLSAIKKAAYKFGDRCHVIIATDDHSMIRVTMYAKVGVHDAGTLAGELQNEILDQELREVVAAETEGVRNVLLAQAFSETSLLDPLGDSGDADADPLGIRKADRE
jgi:His-Xaa-Ser system protein HxsD